MYSELVKKLRNRRVCIQSGGNLERDFPVMREAADAIEELQAINQRQLLEIAVLSKPRWIPVTERLPEDDVAVLVTYIGYNSHKLQADLLAYRYDGTWLWVEDATSYAPLGTVECAVPITHWMPLPEPPKEETE